MALKGFFLFLKSVCSLDVSLAVPRASAFISQPSHSATNSTIVVHAGKLNCYLLYLCMLWL